MKFNVMGFIPTLLLILPVVFACFKTPADRPDLPEENIIVFIAKCVGRFGCIGYMSLIIGGYQVAFSSKLLFVLWLIISIAAVAFYWLMWAAQYKKGNHFEDMYKTGIPLFIIPGAYVLLTGLLTLNMMLIIFSALDLVCEYCAAYTVRKQLREGITVSDDDDNEEDEVEDTDTTAEEKSETEQTAQTEQEETQTDNNENDGNADE